MAENDFVMRVVKTEEAGYKSALIGLAKNKKISVERAAEVAMRLYDKDDGHNKFLESIDVWLDVTAPRDWWQEADTYRLTTKQSESTMHTLVKEITELYKDYNDSEIEKHMIKVNKYIDENFECGWDSITPQQWNKLIDAVLTDKPIHIIKRKVPEGFLQSRLWKVSYKTLRGIVKQRSKHRMPHWPEFIKLVKEQIDHPGFLQ